MILHKGDEVIIIKDTSGHGIPLGAVINIDNIELREHDERTIITTKEFGSTWIYIEDVKLNKRNKKRNKEKFIITDPELIIKKYILDEIIEYNTINNKINFKNQKFPISTINPTTNEEIKIYTIETTPYKNSGYEENNEYVESTSGLLCLAENKNKWNHEEYGITRKTLKEAKETFNLIINKL